MLHETIRNDDIFKVFWGEGEEDVLWEMWKLRIAYGCGAHLGLVFLLEAALFLRVSNCSVIFLSFVRKLAVTKG